MVARGTASLEAAAGVSGAMEAVYSRVAVLLARALGGPADATFPAAGAIAGEADLVIARPAVAIYGAKTVARAAAYEAYRLCCYAPHWRIGYRLAGTGDDVWARRSLGGAPWRVLKDPGDRFFADPFPVRWQGRDYLFFEDFGHRAGKGVISVVEFAEDGSPGPVRPALEAPFHLSYPFMIERDGELFMIPEASGSGEVAIYRAAAFPDRWEKLAILVAGVEAADATVVEHDGRWWMFAVTREGIGGYSDTLEIWHAEDLFGPWRPIRGNPVMVDDRAARPAGAMMRLGGELYRPVQDCRARYGAALGLARVTRLTVDSFDQQVETVLEPGPAWPGRRIHTLNTNGWLEAIDGSAIMPRWKPLARLLGDRRF